MPAKFFLGLSETHFYELSLNKNGCVPLVLFYWPGIRIGLGSSRDNFYESSELKSKSCVQLGSFYLFFYFF